MTIDLGLLAMVLLLYLLMVILSVKSTIMIANSDLTVRAIKVYFDETKNMREDYNYNQSPKATNTSFEQNKQ